ncbi:C-type lectin domain family 4 member C isoform X1 [Pongo pygmaeus]|uniref:C-type lectin domain family 4 member C n=2 Tax=Pongo abelii TaxID=9601 RepID=A0A6D2WFC6_PONAB|nr:C-type lectin domain family 4 member C isoform X1 [Pongo pygmaeus]XP_054382731.1 C-type lectin domain family 4 member C isoform X1 [Pongo abelii]PNJ30509.1 CLEC4C isoform 2 [Pongo abelii]PNJ30511.1 CLEC4C isoform 4 [Pongo abelii]
MVPEEEPQDREKGFWWFQLKVWSVAVVSILLLSVCFTVSCVVTHNFICSKTVERLSKLRECQQYHPSLTCVVEGKDIEDWSCCPTPWTSFQSSCYFISTVMQSWTKSQKNCSVMGADLVVINTKEEQDFIIQNLKRNSSYFLGLSDPEGRRHWQWVDQTPYNENVTFWHRGEPNNLDERCAIINFRSLEEWGWNDVHCHVPQKSICKMKKIYI